MTHLDVEIRAVILLPRLKLNSFHLLGGDIEDPRYSSWGEAELRVKRWLKRYEWKWRTVGETRPTLLSCWGVTDPGVWAVPSLNSLTQLLPIVQENMGDLKSNFGYEECLPSTGLFYIEAVHYFLRFSILKLLPTLVLWTHRLYSDWMKSNGEYKPLINVTITI